MNDHAHTATGRAARILLVLLVIAAIEAGLRLAFGRDVANLVTEGVAGFVGGLLALAVHGAVRERRRHRAGGGWPE